MIPRILYPRGRAQYPTPRSSEAELWDEVSLPRALGGRGLGEAGF